MTHLSVQAARRILLASLAAAALLSQPARAEDKWPSQPIRFVVAFAPGGITDIVARLIGERVSDKLGQTVIIDNKGGAAGAVGAKMVAASKPDGYTFLVTTTALTIGAASSPSLVDPRSQLVPVAMVASAPSLIATRNPTDATDLRTFAKKLKDVTYASAGVGTVEHLNAAYVLNIPGVKATHVPYRSGGEAVNAAIGGHVNLTSTPLGVAMPFIQDKQLRVLGVASHTPIAALPDAPTFKEAGLADMDNATWVAIFAPLGTPEAYAQRINAAVNETLGNAEFRERLNKMGFDLHPLSQQLFAEQMRTEVDKWGKILKETGITLN